MPITTVFCTHSQGKKRKVVPILIWELLCKSEDSEGLDDLLYYFTLEMQDTGAVPLTRWAVFCSLTFFKVEESIEYEMSHIHQKCWTRKVLI